MSEAAGTVGVGLGYTEPHPRDDLSGADVARNAPTWVVSEQPATRLHGESLRRCP